MEATAATIRPESIWKGGNRPLGASYGKMMMWFFIVSDALTFTGFLAAYGFSRYKFIETWPIADEVFTHFPFLHGVSAPMYYVALMTFILIFSSVTMVLAVDAGHQMKKNKVAFYMFLTIIGGLIFVGSQAWEWKNFIKGEHGALETKGGQILQFVDANTGKQIGLHDFATGSHTERERHERSNGLWFKSEKSLPSISLNDVKAGFEAQSGILIRTQEIVPDLDKLAESPRVKDQQLAEKLKTQLVNPDAFGHKAIYKREFSEQRLNDAVAVVEGANLHVNEYGNRLFADFFFFITGFHGFHVFSGVVINIIVFFNIILGTYERRGHYEMVEKVGLYWHFVDLVWVFVFTFFYLV